MSNCGGCDQVLPSNGDFVTCGTCSRAYHYDECSGLAQNTWLSKSASDKGKWRCKNCRSSTTTRSRANSFDDKLQPDIAKELQLGFQLIKKSLEDMFSKQFGMLREQQSKFEKLMEASNQRMENLSVSLTDAWKGINDLRGQIKTINKNMLDANAEVDALRIDMQVMEQYSRNKNIEICGVPFNKEEDIRAILSNLFDKLKINVLDREYIAHRLPPKEDGSRGIIVQFTNRSTRNEVLLKGKANRLKLVDLGQQYPATPLYINENMSPFFKKTIF